MFVQTIDDGFPANMWSLPSDSLRFVAKMTSFSSSSSSKSLYSSSCIGALLIESQLMISLSFKVLSKQEKSHFAPWMMYCMSLKNFLPVLHYSNWTPIHASTPREKEWLIRNILEVSERVLKVSLPFGSYMKPSLVNTMWTSQTFNESS